MAKNNKDQQMPKPTKEINYSFGRGPLTRNFRRRNSTFKIGKVKYKHVKTYSEGSTGVVREYTHNVVVKALESNDREALINERDALRVAGNDRLATTVTEGEQQRLIMIKKPGISLSDWFKQNSTTEISLKLYSLCYQVFSELVLMHARKDQDGKSYAHLDLHANNILVDDTRKKINISFIDFGNARVIGNEQSGCILSKDAKDISDLKLIETLLYYYTDKHNKEQKNKRDTATNLRKLNLLKKLNKKRNSEKEKKYYNEEIQFYKKHYNKNKNKIVSATKNFLESHIHIPPETYTGTFKASAALDVYSICATLKTIIAKYKIQTPKIVRALEKGSLEKEGDRVTSAEVFRDHFAQQIVLMNLLYLCSRFIGKVHSTEKKELIGKSKQGFSKPLKQLTEPEMKKQLTLFLQIILQRTRWGFRTTSRSSREFISHCNKNASLLEALRMHTTGNASNKKITHAELCSLAGADNRSKKSFYSKHQKNNFKEISRSLPKIPKFGKK